MSDLPGVHIIRQRVATAVAAALPNVRESVFHPKLIGYDGAGAIGAFFSVEVPSTRITDPRNRTVTRSAVNQSTRVETTVLIRYLHRLKTDTARASYDEAITVESSIVSALANVVYTNTNALAPVGMEREVIGDGTWVLITITGTITHNLGGDG